MALTWVICGAGSGVGKTHLALKLCEVLPNALYAKRGCGERKPGKPPNLFSTLGALSSFVDARRAEYEHIVIECNLRARRERDDIIIFVDGSPKRAAHRADVSELRAKAHLHVHPDLSIRDCEGALRDKLSSATVRRAVCDVLLAQGRYIRQFGSLP